VALEELEDADVPREVIRGWLDPALLPLPDRGAAHATDSSRDLLEADVGGLPNAPSLGGRRKLKPRLEFRLEGLDFGCAMRYTHAT
jgi:hypothetical protein